MDLIYKTGIRLAKATYRFLGYKLNIKGEENLPDYPYIIAANHISFADIAAIMVAINKTSSDKYVRFIAKAYWTSGFTGFLLNRFNPIPVGGLVALKEISDKEVLAIFPEGTRGDGKEIGKFRNGVGKISTVLNRPVVPAYIGGDNPWKKGEYRPPIRRGSVSKIIFGNPITPKKDLENDVRNEIIRLRELY